MQSPEPIFDIAHLGHVELLTDKPQESLDFFVNVFGLTESGREGDSVYLRAYDDYEFHTLKLTAANTTGMRHVGYRASSPQALHRRVAAIESAGRRHRLERGRSGPWPGLSVPRSRRPCLRDLFRDPPLRAARA